MCGELSDDSRKFQEFAGLKKTGVLDDQTKQKMAEPRCGVTDVLAVTSGGAGFSVRCQQYSSQYFSTKHNVFLHNYACTPLFLLGGERAQGAWHSFLLKKHVWTFSPPYWIGT